MLLKRPGTNRLPARQLTAALLRLVLRGMGRLDHENQSARVYRQHRSCSDTAAAEGPSLPKHLQEASTRHVRAVCGSMRWDRVQQAACPEAGR